MISTKRLICLRIERLRLNKGFRIDLWMKSTIEICEASSEPTVLGSPCRRVFYSLVAPTLLQTTEPSSSRADALSFFF